ncbi:hypothetical protein LJR030_005389 [Rhizobium sp. LjRoot30]|uniref:hypothetical protein n=1 Tax=Rhizobium sp. LjRoot30 TaxID=3342320 RepID=UPI003ECC648E
MTKAKSFAAELIRAANEVEKLGDFELRRLLDRAVTTIREMRDEVGIPPSHNKADAVIDLQTVSGMVNIGRRSNDDVKAALLDAASMIKTLKIILDAE